MAVCIGCQHVGYGNRQGATKAGYNRIAHETASTASVYHANVRILEWIIELARRSILPVNQRLLHTFIPVPAPVNPSHSHLPQSPPRLILIPRTVNSAAIARRDVYLGLLPVLWTRR